MVTVKGHKRKGRVVKIHFRKNISVKNKKRNFVYPQKSMGITGMTLGEDRESDLRLPKY